MITEKLEAVSISAKAIRELAAMRSDAIVSIYLPIAKPGSDEGDNQTALKSAIGEAKEQLIARGRDPENAEAFLSRLNYLVEDKAALNLNTSSVALFVSEENVKCYTASADVEQTVRVEGNCYVLPLIEYLDEGPKTLVLTLSRGEVATYDRIGETLTPVKVDSLISSIEDISENDIPQDGLQSHVSKSTSATGRPGSTQMTQLHGHGGANEYQDTLETRFAQTVSGALSDYLPGDYAALLVIGLSGNSGEVTKNLESLPIPILVEDTDPTALSDNELAEKVESLMAERCVNEPSASVEELEIAIGQSAALTSVDECVKAAISGRIKLLSVDSSAQVLGRVIPEELSVVVTDAENDDASIDLLNYAAIETLRYGGEVKKADRLGEGASGLQIAALLRG